MVNNLNSKLNEFLENQKICNILKKNVFTMKYKSKENVIQM